MTQSNGNRRRRLIEPVKIIGFETVTEARLRQITRRIVRAYKPERVVLFGSFAAGRATPHSDVDLLIVKRTMRSTVERYRVVSDLFVPRPFPMDILVYTPGEWHKAIKAGDQFAREIIETGRVMYERRG